MNERMETSKRINMIAELRRHYKIRRNKIAYAALTSIRRWLVWATEIVDKILEDI